MGRLLGIGFKMILMQVLLILSSLLLYGMYMAVFEPIEPERHLVTLRQQHEITQGGMLLHKNGSLAEAGWSRYPKK